MQDYTSYVNIKQGTYSKPSFSNGNTLPLVAAPFGMNSFSLQTQASDEGWFFHPSHHTTEGIRLTHQPSPWVRDYGHFVFMPQCGDVYISENERRSEFTEIEMNPAFMEVYFKHYEAKMGVAASDRGAIINICWDTNKTPRFAMLPFDFPTYWELNPETCELKGYINAYGDGTRRDFKMYFCMKFDQTINVSQTFITDKTGIRETGSSEKIISGNGIGVGINIAFNISSGEELNIRLGTSYISTAFARANMERETANKTYGELKNETRTKWNELLSKIELTDTEEKKKTFYSCMYRCFLFPRMFYEYDEEGKPIHYSTKTGEVRKGVMYTDNGFWDTYRTLYPLFSLIIPDRMKKMLEGYLNFYLEEGWLPKWLSPGERGIMPGTLIDAVFTDAAVKGLLTNEQMELALKGMLKNANIPSGTHLNGRIGVADYVKKGYVPADKYGESVNNSLDAYYCDYCISRLADMLGRTEIRDEYLKRSQNYKLLFDETAGFIRGLNSDGNREENFSPTRWGGEYCEGAAWQNAFGVYHDIDGLSRLYGGKDKFIEKLDELFSAPPVFEVGTYNTEIHEMTEMAVADFGQCAISNQPSFHIPYLFSAVGDNDKTAYWVKRIVNEAFDSSEKGFPGDEDNGSMSAWYIFSVLGFYPLCPGKAEYVTGVCNAKAVKLHLGNGNILAIDNEIYNISNPNGVAVNIDGKTKATQFISHNELINAQIISFSQR